jgi:hypothetical protein
MSPSDLRAENLEQTHKEKWKMKDAQHSEATISLSNPSIDLEIIEVGSVSFSPL